MMVGVSLGSFRGLTLEDSVQLYIKLLKEFDIKAIEVSFERKVGSRVAADH